MCILCGGGCVALCSCCILNDEKSLSYNIRIGMKNIKNNKNEVKQPN